MKGKYSKVIRKQQEDFQSLVSCADRFLAEKDAEIERLRQALRDVMNAENCPYEVASRALAFFHEEQQP